MHDPLDNVTLKPHTNNHLLIQKRALVQELHTQHRQLVSDMLCVFEDHPKLLVYYSTKTYASFCDAIIRDAHVKCGLCMSIWYRA